MQQAIHKALAASAPFANRGFYYPPRPDDWNTIFYYDYSRLATVIVTLTKVLAVISGFYLVWSVHKKEKERLKLPEWDTRSKKPYLLPIYHGFLYVMLLLFCIEIVLLNLWEFDSTWAYIAIGELFIQSLICEGLVHPLTANSVSGRSILSSMPIVTLFAAYGAVFGVFVARCAEHDLTYRYSFILLALYNFFPLFYHAYIVFPFSSSSNVLPKRLAVKSFSRWIFVYRLTWMVFHLLTYLSHIEDFTSPLLYYATVSFLALFELPFAFVVVAMVRVDTVYWHSGAQNFLRTYTQQIALENKQFNQSGMAITTLDDELKDRLFTVPNVTKYLIESPYLADSDRILQCVPSVERDLRKLVQSHVSQVQSQREMILRRKAEALRKEQEQQALYQQQMAFAVSNNNNHPLPGLSPFESGPGAGAGAGDDFHPHSPMSRNGSNLSRSGSLLDLPGSPGTMPRVGSIFGVPALGSLTRPSRGGAFLNDNHFLVQNDGEGDQGSLKSGGQGSHGSQGSRHLDLADQHDNDSDYDHLEDIDSVGRNDEGQGNGNGTETGNRPGNTSYRDSEQSGLSKPFMNPTKHNRNRKTSSAAFGGSGGGTVGSTTSSGSLDVDGVVGFLAQVNKHQFPAEEIQLHNAFMEPDPNNSFLALFGAGVQNDQNDQNGQNGQNGQTSPAIPMGMGNSAPVEAKIHVSRHGELKASSSRAQTSYTAKHRGGEGKLEGLEEGDDAEGEDGEETTLFSHNLRSTSSAYGANKQGNINSLNSYEETLDPLTHLTGLGSRDTVEGKQNGFRNDNNNNNNNNNNQNSSKRTQQQRYYYHDIPMSSNISMDDDNIMRNDPLSPAVAMYAELYDNNTDALGRTGSVDSFSRSKSNFAETRAENRFSACLIACFGPGVWDILTFGLYTLFDSYRYSDRDDLEEEEEALAMITPSLDEELKRSEKGLSPEKIEDVTDFNKAITHPQLALLNNADTKTLDLLQQVIDSNQRSLIALNQLEIFSNKILGQGTFAFVFMGELSLRAAQQSIRKKILFHNRSNKPRRFVGLFDVFLHSVSRQFQRDPNSIVRQTLFQTHHSSLSSSPNNPSLSLSQLPGSQSSSKRALLDREQPEQRIHPTTPHINDEADYGNVTSLGTRLMRFFFAPKENDQNNDRLDLDLTKYLLRARDMYSTQAMWQMQFQSYAILSRAQAIVSMLPSLPVSNRLDHSCLTLPIAPQASLFERILLPNTSGVALGPDQNQDATKVGFSAFQLHCLLSLCTMLYLQQTIFTLYKTRLRAKKYRFHPSQLVAGGLHCTNHTPIDKAGSTQFSSAQISQLQQEQRASQTGSVGDSVKKISSFVLKVFDTYRQIVPSEKQAFQALYQKPLLHQLQETTLQKVLGYESGDLEFDTETLTQEALQCITEDPLLKQQVAVRNQLSNSSNQQQQLSTGNFSYTNQSSFGTLPQSPINAFNAPLSPNSSFAPSNKNNNNTQIGAQSFQPNANTNTNNNTNTLVPNLSPSTTSLAHHTSLTDTGSIEEAGGFFFINLQSEQTQRLISTFLHDHSQETKFPVQQLFAGCSSIIAKIEHNRRKVSYLKRLGSASAQSSNTPGQLFNNLISNVFEKNRSLSPKPSSYYPGNHQINTISHDGETTWWVNENIFSNNSPGGGHNGHNGHNGQNNRLVSFGPNSSASPTSSTNFNQSSGSNQEDLLISSKSIPMGADNTRQNGQNFVQNFPQSPQISQSFHQSAFGSPQSPFGTLPNNFFPSSSTLNLNDSGAEPDMAGYVMIDANSPSFSLGKDYSTTGANPFNQFSGPFNDQLSYTNSFKPEHSVPFFSRSSSNVSTIAPSTTTAYSTSNLNSISSPQNLSKSTKHQAGRISLYDLEDDSKPQAGTNTGQQRVVDTVAIKFFKKTPNFSPSSVIAIAKETSLHCKMQHPNIVYCYGILVAPPTLAVLTEICARGDLYGLIEAQGALRRRFLHLTELTQSLLRAFKKVMEPSKDSKEVNSVGGGSSSALSLSGSQHQNPNQLRGALQDKTSSFNQSIVISPRSLAPSGQNGQNSNQPAFDFALPALTEQSTQDSGVTDETHTLMVQDQQDVTNATTLSLSLPPAQAPEPQSQSQTQTQSQSQPQTALSQSQTLLGGDQLRASSALGALSTKTIIRSLHFAHRRLGLISTQLWSLRTRLIFAIDAATAVAYCHSKQLLHRDIKSLNFFVNDDQVVKLADFGISKVLKERASDLNYEYRKLIFSHPALRRDNVTVPMISSLLNKPNFPNDDGPRLCLDHGAEVWHVDFAGASKHVHELQSAAKYVTQLSRQYFQDHSNSKSVKDGVAPWIDRHSAYEEPDFGKLIAHTLLQRVEAWHIDNNQQPLSKFYQNMCTNDANPNANKDVMQGQNVHGFGQGKYDADDDDRDLLFTKITTSSKNQSSRAPIPATSTTTTTTPTAATTTTTTSNRFGAPSTKTVTSTPMNPVPSSRSEIKASAAKYKLNFEQLSKSSSLLGRFSVPSFDALAAPQRPAYEFPTPAVFMTQEQSFHGTINLNNVYEQPPATLTPQQLRKVQESKKELLAQTYGPDATPATVLGDAVESTGTGLGSKWGSINEEKNELKQNLAVQRSASLLGASNLTSSLSVLKSPSNPNQVGGSPAGSRLGGPSASASASTAALSPHAQIDFFYDPLAEFLNIISIDGENPLFGITSISPNREVMAEIDAKTLNNPTTRTYLSEFSEFGDFSFSFAPKPRVDEQELARLGIPLAMYHDETAKRAEENVQWSFFSDSTRYSSAGFNNRSSISKHTTNQGTPQWLAPEAFDSPSAEQLEVGDDEDPKSIIEYSYPVDVYALGLTLWEILCIQPMDARDLDSSTLRFTRDIPFQLRLLLLSSIDQRAQLRPTAKQIVDVLTMHLYMLDFVATFLNNSSMLKL